jgi:hypothetical protein
MGPPQHASEQTPATAASGCPQAPRAAARLGVCGAAHSDLRHERLEAFAVDGGGTRLAQI